MFGDVPKNQNYDAILMDIQMPVMNGWEAAKAIRSLDLAKAKTIPIIAVTANSFQRDIQASKDAGMDAHISKPFNVQELLKILQAKIQKKQIKVCFFIISDRLFSVANLDVRQWQQLNQYCHKRSTIGYCW